MTDVKDQIFFLGFCAFKISLRFLLVSAALIGLDRAAGYLCILLLIAIDLASHSTAYAIKAAATSVKDNMWHQTLTNRFFYEQVAEKLRSSEPIWVNALFEEATKAATKDIAQYREDKEFDFQLGMSKFATATFSFLWYVVIYLATYGIPLYLFRNYCCRLVQKAGFTEIQRNRTCIPLYIS